MSNFSTKSELETIAEIVKGYARTPLAQDSIPGSLMEGILASVRGSERLNTYDFIDVYSEKLKVGWQVKSTKDSTPVTWKRAKIANSQELISEARQSKFGLQKLGDAIIDYCNSHVEESIRIYKLDCIYYSRLVLFEKNNEREVLYFEKLLCTKDDPVIFKSQDFVWDWSAQKNTVKKEQLSALHGKNINTRTKWFAWHGLGENQLHFTGEKAWWPNQENTNCIRFKLSDVNEQIDLNQFFDILKNLK